MKFDGYLSEKVGALLPVPEETEAVRMVERQVEEVFERGRRQLGLVEQYRCGSLLKDTHLAGHRQGDHVLLLESPPNSEKIQRLSRFAAESLPLAEAPRLRHDVLELTFRDLSRVGLVIVGHELSEVELMRLPERLRVGANGNRHVEWFRQHAQHDAIRPLIRLLKHMRLHHGALERALSSFAIEVLCVRLLMQYGSSSLEACLEHVLSRVRDGELGLKGLVDPVNSRNDLLSRTTSPELEELQKVMKRMLDALEKDNASFLFTGAMSAPFAASNLGGRTLG